MTASKRSRFAARRLFRLCAVGGVLQDARARQVAQRIAGSRRRGALAILSQFRRLVRLDRHRHTAVVASAAPLSHAQREDVEAGLARRYGSTLATAFEQDPRLIAGMRIRVGSDVYDGSVQARLAALAARL